MGRTRTICILSDEQTHVVVLDGHRTESKISAEGTVRHTNPDSLLIDHDAEAIAEAVAEACHAIDCQTDSVTLVIPAQWCFMHVLVSGSKRINATALAFEFEEYLPLPLEQVTCAFARINEDRVLALAVPTAPMAALIGQLHARGIRVRNATTDTVALALAHSHQDTEVVACVLDDRWTRVMDVRNDAEGCGVRVTAASSPTVQWPDSLLPSVCDDEFGNTFNGTMLDLRLCEPSEYSISNKETLPHRAPSGQDAIDELARCVVASGHDLNLRTGALRPRGGRGRMATLSSHCLVLAIALVLILIVGMELRQRAMTRNLQDVLATRDDIYRQVFEGKTIVPGGAMHVASERVRLEALTHTTQSNDSLLNIDRSAVDTMREVVAAWPDDVRIMLLDARVEGGQLTLRGQTGGHRDAERMVEAINGVTGVKARPPRTRRLETGGVEFSIIAQIGTEK